MNKSDFERDENLRISWAGELTRKATHLGALIVPFLYLWLGLSKLQALMALVPATLLALTIDISRLRRGRIWGSVERLVSHMIRKHEDHGDFMGSSYILVAMCLTITLFEPIIAAVSLAFIIVGDTFAALVGRKWGRIRFKNKSLEGSLACLLSTVVVALFASEFLHLPLIVGLVGAIVATSVEAAPDILDDNLSVPLASGLAMTFGMLWAV